MASFTLRRPDVFPNGTTVTVYPRTVAGVPNAGAPAGTTAASGVVSSDAVTFSGLAVGDFVSYAGSPDRYISFSTRTSSSSSSSGSGSSGASTSGSSLAPLPQVGGANPWGLRLRGAIPSSGLLAGGALNNNYWGVNWTQAMVDTHLSQVVSVGANLVKGIGQPWPVWDGAVTQATYLGRIASWLDQTKKLGLFVYFLITDNVQSPATGHVGTLAEEIGLASALSALLDTYEHVVGLDLLNEVNGWQVSRGGPGSYAASQPDATSVAWLTGPGSLAAAVRANTSKPLAASLYVESSAELLANTAADWLPLVTATYDFLDIHPYWTAPGDMTVGNLNSLHALYPNKPVYFGEVSAFGKNALSPEIKRRIEVMRDFMEKPYVPGVNIYTLNDYTNYLGTGTGMFDQNGVERPNMTYPFRTLPRRSVYAGPQEVPLLAPSAALALTTSLQAVPNARFPINADAYGSNVGDANYRVTGAVSVGLSAGDVIELQAYDLDTNLAVASGTATVSSLGNPTVADSSPSNAPGAVAGGATAVAGKFSNGINVASIAHQVVFPDVFRPVGAQPFTVECWVKRARTGTSLQEDVSSQWLGGATFSDVSWLLTFSNNRIQAWWINSSNSFASTGTATLTDTAAFHHVALSYDGTTMRSFLDGAVSGSVATTLHAAATSQPISISGSWNSNANWFNGVIDEFRYSNNARYTGAFTPSAAAFTSDANTMLLAHLDAVTTGSTFPVVTVSTPWTFMPSGAQVNAGIRARNATAARGSLLNAAAEVRYT